MRCPPGCPDQLLSAHFEIRIVRHGPQLAGNSWKSCIANSGVQRNGGLARGARLCSPYHGLYQRTLILFHWA